MAECKSIEKAERASLIMQSVTAGLILLILSFMKKRVRCCPQTLKGIPGLIVPVNLLRVTPHRIINAVAFASMSSTILTNLLFPTRTFGNVGNAYGQVFIEELSKWFWMLYQTVLYFPLFGCLNSPIRWLGMMMGAVYCTLSLTTIVLNFVSTWCPMFEESLHSEPLWLSLAMNIPIYACFVILIIYYTTQFIQKTFKTATTPNGCHKLGWNQHNNEETEYYKQCVKELLRYKRLDNSNTAVHKYEPKLFKFSTRFISATVIMFVLVYQLMLFSISVLLAFLPIVEPIAERLGGAKVTKGLKAAAVIGPCITSIIVLCTLIYMVKCIRNDLKKAVRGDFSSLHVPCYTPETSFLSVQIPSPTEILASSLKYMAHQIAHLVVGWILILCAVFGFGAAIGGIVALFIFARSLILPKVVSIIVALILVLIVSIVQKCMCKYVFTNRTFETSGEKQSAKDTVIAHIQLYHWWTYVFFIINTFGGLLSSFLRSLGSAAIVMLLLIRMDRNIYMRGLERFDTGYSTYIAFLHLEYIQNNPVMSAFVQILGNAVDGAATFDDQPHKDSGTRHIEKGYCCTSKRARNRWYVAYTLLRNPDLQHLTWNRLNEASISTDLSKPKLRPKPPPKPDEASISTDLFKPKLKPKPPPKPKPAAVHDMTLEIES